MNIENQQLRTAVLLLRAAHDKLEAQRWAEVAEAKDLIRMALGRINDVIANQRKPAIPGGDPLFAIWTATGSASQWP